jgi:hypothetical protein
MAKVFASIQLAADCSVNMKTFPIGSGGNVLMLATCCSRTHKFYVAVKATRDHPLRIWSKSHVGNT